MLQQVEERSQLQRGTPKFDDSLVVVSRYGTIWKLDARTGKILWQHVSNERVGSLIHTGDTIYFASYVLRPVRKEIDLPPNISRKAMPRHPYITAEPPYITALQARDGAVLWKREGWRMRAGPYIARDGDLLITNSLDPEIGERVISGIDMHTGETRLIYHAAKVSESSLELVAVRAGRVYLCSGSIGKYFDLHLHALDAQTGKEVWDREQIDTRLTFSPSGKLLSVVNGAQTDIKRRRLILNTADGSVVAETPDDDPLLALTDDGVTYVVRNPQSNYKRQIAALRVDGLTELWRVTSLDFGITQATDTALYYGHLTQPRNLAEVGAHDPLTGKRLWRWRSPGNIITLLLLWGRRIPDMLAFALSEARRSLVRSRESHDRGIFMREVIHGQWRRPWALIGHIQLTVGKERVYVGTNLGIFALNARTGRRLWHELPTRDLSVVAPALPPEP
jgi:outer membrane protein assembly factor BamB